MGEETRQDRVVDWIESNTSFVKGTTLQSTFFSENAPERCIMVREMNGTQDLTQVRKDVMYQVVSRAPAPDDAREDSYTVYALLNKNGNFELPPAPATAEFQVDYIEPINTPQYGGKDEKHRILYITNYKFIVFVKGGKL